jgi:hypothetical protein
MYRHQLPLCIFDVNFLEIERFEIEMSAQANLLFSNLPISTLSSTLHDFRQRTANRAKGAGIERRLPGALKNKEGERQDAQHAAQKGVHPTAMARIERCQDAGKQRPGQRGKRLELDRQRHRLHQSGEDGNQ